MPERTNLTLASLLERTVPRFGPYILSNEIGAVELRSAELYVESDGGRWLALYERGAGNPEGRSHMHLRTTRFRYACVIEPEGDTPFIGFYRDAASVDPERPPLAAYFPSFVDWDHGQRPIEEHRRFFAEWVARNGRAFELFDP